MTVAELVDELRKLDLGGTRKVVLDGGEEVNHVALLGSDAVYLWHRVTRDDHNSKFPPPA